VEGLRPPALDHGGLLSALQQHADLSADMAVANSPEVSFEVVGDLSVLPAASRSRFTRLRKRPSATRQPSSAQLITVQMTRRDNGLTIEIDDDGIGAAADTNPSRVGLASMSERATQLGGWCTNEDSPAGCTGSRPGCRS
jgi:signal transduction histidine kinase